MREIRFRAWIKDLKKMFYSEGSLAKFFSDISYRNLEWSLGDVELMQFTGLKDKNGKEIYEGDVVRNGVVNGEIKFSDGAFIISTNLDDEPLYLIIDLTKNIKVLGNIYQNKDLLTQPQDSQHEEGG